MENYYYKDECDTELIIDSNLHRVNDLNLAKEIILTIRGMEDLIAYLSDLVKFLKGE